MIENREILFAQLSLGAVIITPNNRLSNQLLHDFFKQRPDNNGISGHEKPRCLPYQAFLRELFKHVCHLHAKKKHPILLSNQQQRHLWQQILSAHQDYPCNDGLLHKVQDAWTRCQHWQMDANQPAFAQTPQTLQFQQWQQQFQNKLKKIGAITEEQLTNYVLSHLNKFNFTKVIWACFDDYTPQQRSLQNAIDLQGCQQSHYDLAKKTITSHQYPAKDDQDEQLQMIRWLKARIDAGDQRIGVVVPDLQSQSDRLQRLFQRYIPQDQFNISLGKALINYPIVTHALNWLDLDKQAISIHKARLLLHSPYLAGAKKEFIARSDAMQNSKLVQESIISFTTMVEEINHVTPKLAELLNKLANYPREASPYSWISHFKTRLIALGFPGEYPLNSSTYQCFQRFIALFDELLQLSVINPVMNKMEALATLHSLAKTTIFQPRKSTTTILILGLLEASGCTFDSVWISGLSDQCLPQKTNFSAFIPIDLQREWQMPHAIPARELQFAQQMLERLQHGSQQSVVSYPRLIGDMPNLPSPLINHLPILPVNELQPLSRTSSLVQREENYTLPLGITEPILGGTTLLANQAKCPFRAFAAHRLHAKQVPDVSTGPNASERGQILHRVMDILWQRLGSQQTLLTVAQEELNKYIEEAILMALTPFIHQRYHSFSTLIQDVECSRLKRLVNACLDWEKKRPPFIVEAAEQAFTINLAGLDFRVRIDRLDKVESDKRWVIDYKSKIPINKPWNEDRPEAPQLLLYALLDETINTLLFVELKTGQLTCNGISEDSLPVKGITALKKNEHWATRQEQWHQQLTQLANEFRIGHCPPEPNRTSTCQRCEFQNLCRIEPP